MIELDSSVLLADYLDQPAAGRARSFWDRDDELVSSFILVAEVPVVLRRAYLAAGRGVAKALEARLGEDPDVGILERKGTVLSLYSASDVAPARVLYAIKDVGQGFRRDDAAGPDILRDTVVLTYR